VGHDLLKGLGLIVPQENRDKNSLIGCHISDSLLLCLAFGPLCFFRSNRA
jgi:hypothetical protein